MPGRSRETARLASSANDDRASSSAVSVSRTEARVAVRVLSDRLRPIWLDSEPNGSGTSCSSIALASIGLGLVRRRPRGRFTEHDVNRAAIYFGGATSACMLFESCGDCVMSDDRTAKRSTMVLHRSAEEHDPDKKRGSLYLKGIASGHGPSSATSSRSIWHWRSPPRSSGAGTRHRRSAIGTRLAHPWHWHSP